MIAEDGTLCPPAIALVPNPVVAVTTRVVIADPRPISVNKAYTVHMGRKKLTAAGRKYKDAVRRQVATSSFAWKAAFNGVYEEGGYVELHIAYFVETLYNASWSPGALTKPKPRKDGTRAKPQRRSPYQHLDVGNILKLLEDAVVSGSGIDDSNTLDIHLYKREDAQNPRVEVIHRVMIPS